MEKEAYSYNLYTGKTHRTKIAHNVTQDEIILESLFALFCFMMGRAIIFGDLAPFGLALAASLYLRKNRGIMYFLAAGAGLLSLGPIIPSFRYLVAYAILLLYGKTQFAKRFKDNSIHIAIVVFVSLIAVNLGYSFMRGMITYLVITGFFESIIAFVATYMFGQVVGLALNHSNRRVLSDEETICSGVFLVILIAGLWNGEIYGISLQRLASVLLTISAAYAGGAGTGASIGIMTGLMLSVVTNSSPELVASLGICGLVAGTFKNLGRVGVSTAFAITNILFTFYLNRSTVAVISTQEVILGIVSLIIFPKTYLKYIRQLLDYRILHLKEQRGYVMRMKDILKNRLNEFSRIFSELGRVFSENSDCSIGNEKNDWLRLVSIIVDQACDSCPLHRSCWQRDSDRKYTNLVELLKLAESAGTLKREQIPAEIARNCFKIDHMIDTVNQVYRTYRTNRLWRRKIEEYHNLVKEQMNGVSNAVLDLANEIDIDLINNRDFENALLSELDKNGVRVADAVLVGENGAKQEVNIIQRSCGEKLKCVKQIEKIVSSVMDRPMIALEPDCSSKKDPCVLRLVESNKFHILTGVTKRSKYPNNVCGDSYTAIPLKNGKYMLALSDGMGSGVEAANESNAVIGLLENLLEAGFDMDVSMRTINSVMMLRKESDAFATADLCVIDLILGSATIVKTGAVSSFIKCKDHIKVIKSPNLPIGVMDNLQVEETRLTLEDEDMIVMVSDGVLESEEIEGEPDEWLANILAGLDSKNPQELAEYLMREAVKSSNGILKDDMTVIVSRVWMPFSGRG